MVICDRCGGKEPFDPQKNAHQKMGTLQGINGKYANRGDKIIGEFSFYEKSVDLCLDCRDKLKYLIRDFLENNTKVER